LEENKCDAKVPVLFISNECKTSDNFALQFLSDEGYDVEVACHGNEALDMLVASNGGFDVIIVDVSVLGIESIDLLRAIRQLAGYTFTPVIMQAPKVGYEDMREVIKNGAYYYLSKPYDREKLVAIVGAAQADEKQRRIDSGLIHSNFVGFGMVEECHLNVTTLDEAKKTAFMLSQLFPEPDNVFFGIQELLVNAIEHGNLGVGYETKTRLLEEGKWRDEIDRRMALPENREKSVAIHYFYRRSEQQVMLRIQDQGSGFAWQEYMDISPARITDTHGRGIAISARMSFDNLIYLQGGSEVVCMVHAESLSGVSQEDELAAVSHLASAPEQEEALRGALSVW